jgi:hypothetical protein
MVSKLDWEKGQKVNSYLYSDETQQALGLLTLFVQRRE